MEDEGLMAKATKTKAKTTTKAKAPLPKRATTKKATPPPPKRASRVKPRLERVPPPPTNRPPVQATPAGMCSRHTLANLLVLTVMRIDQLVRDKTLMKAGRDLYPIVHNVQAYIRFLRDENRHNSRSAAQQRVQEARAKEIEQRVLRDAHELVAISEHDAIFDEAFAIVRAGLTGLPARLTRDIEFRAKIEAECDDILRRCADKFRETTATIRQTGEAPVPAEADDA